MGQLVSNNGLVHEKKGQAFTNSRMVSENFDKRHEKVLRDIENICKKLPPKNGETYFVDIGLVHAVTDFQQRKAMLEQQYIRLSQKLLKTA